MTQREILNLICAYFNASFEVPFIVSPFSGAAPKGEYIAVRMDDVEQMSTFPMRRGATKVEGDRHVSYPYQGLVYITEVEGAGENIRAVANKVRTQAFLDYCRENDFSIMYVNGAITDNTVSDGDKYFISQKYFSFFVNWIDKENETTLSAIEVSGNVVLNDTGEEKTFEVSTN